MGEPMPWHMWGVQKATLRSQFFPSVISVLSIKSQIHQTGQQLPLPFEQSCQSVINTQ